MSEYVCLHPQDAIFGADSQSVSVQGQNFDRGRPASFRRGTPGSAVVYSRLRSSMPCVIVCRAVPSGAFVPSSALRPARPRQRQPRARRPGRDRNTRVSHAQRTLTSSFFRLAESVSASPRAVPRSALRPPSSSLRSPHTSQPASRRAPIGNVEQRARTTNSDEQATMVSAHTSKARMELPSATRCGGSISSHLRLEMAKCAHFTGKCNAASRR